MEPFASRRDVARAYDAVAAEYAARFTDELDRKPADRDLLDAFAARTRGWVADIGCGPGHVGAYLAARGEARSAGAVGVSGEARSAGAVGVSGEARSAGAVGVSGVRVVGVDLSTRMATRARGVAGDMISLPFRTHSLAGALAYYSLIHLRRDELPAALREIRRAIVPGGELIAAVHAGSGAVHLDEWFGRDVHLSATFFDRDELASLARDAGFAIESCVEREPYETEGETRRIYLSARTPPLAHR